MKQPAAQAGRINYGFDDIELNDLCSLWCMKHHFKALNNTIAEQFKDKTPGYYYKLWNIVETLKSEFQQTLENSELIHKLGQMQVNN